MLHNDDILACNLSYCIPIYHNYFKYIYFLIFMLLLDLIYNESDLFIIDFYVLLKNILILDIYFLYLLFWDIKLTQQAFHEEI